MLELVYRERKTLPLDAGMEAAKKALPQLNRAIVLDSLYQLNEELNGLNPIYWNGETIEAQRGTWFNADSWEPLPSDMADQIEREHLRRFRGSEIPQMPVYSKKERNKKPGECIAIVLRELYAFYLQNFTTFPGATTSESFGTR